MPIIGWVSIGVAVGGAVFAFVFWLIRRVVERLDHIEGAIFGNEGMRERIHSYVTHSTLDAKMVAFRADMRADMRGISEEGQKREERILAAIENQTLVVGSEVREIKTDLRAQATRIDEAMRIAHQNSR